MSENYQPLDRQILQKAFYDAFWKVAGEVLDAPEPLDLGKMVGDRVRKLHVQTFVKDVQDNCEKLAMKYAADLVEEALQTD